MHAALAYVGIGSNLGDTIATIHNAIAALEKLPQTRLITSSSLFQSAPYEASGDDFVNAVVSIETSLTPTALLTQCQSIELAFGRERPFQNSPRTLDLDLLLYGHETINQTSLILPHPRMTERAFVLLPLCEIAPEIIIPGKGLARDYLPQLSQQRIDKLQVESLSSYTR
jgi:2-amino-4-hydroxy-6-hydroxymethyldihydropteridine diphosphokinase